MATVLLIGTLDTKGPETAYLRDRVREQGCQTLVLDSGILGEAVGIEADFSRRQVAEAAGTTIDTLRNAGSRGKAVEGMLKGVRKITLDLLAAGKIQGAVSLGGAEGAVLAAAAMKELPIGFPKLIVSPLASGHRKFAPFVGTKDVLVMHSVVDILGLNPISRAVFDNAASAIVGMAIVYEERQRGVYKVLEYLRTKRNLLIGRPAAERLILDVLSSFDPDEYVVGRVSNQGGRNIITGLPDRIEVNSTEIRQAIEGEPPRLAIAATMLGNTTRPLMRIKPKVEERGMDFVIFHANGVGGPAMEELIAQGQFAAVLDYTLSEVAGQIAGGFHIGGATRMDAAGRAGIPQVVVPGCLDFIAVGAKHEIPESLRDRPTYYHNPEFTLLRLTRDEQLAATQFMIDKLNQAQGRVTVVVPLAGGSVMENRNGGAFWDAETLRLSWEKMRNGLNKSIRYREVDAHINDDAFADAVYDELVQMMI